VRDVDPINADSVELGEIREGKHVDALFLEFPDVLRTRTATYAADGCFLIMDLSCLLRKPVPDIFRDALEHLDQSVKSDRLLVSLARGRFTDGLDVGSRGKTGYPAAIAYGAENGPRSVLSVILFAGLEPAFEAVFLLANEAIYDHGEGRSGFFGRGAA
jgi:hypothetical protein